MNKDRRAELESAAALVGEASAKIAEASTIVECARDDEQAYLDGMPDGLKSGDRGQAAEAAVAAMDEALNELQQIDTANIVRQLEEAGDLSLRAIETVEQKITSKEAEKRRWERLPQWAKDRIARLEGDVERYRAEAASPFREATGGEEEIVLVAYGGGPLDGKALPVNRVALPAYGIVIEARKGYGGAIIRTDDGPLILRPRAANEAVALKGDWL